MAHFGRAFDDGVQRTEGGDEFAGRIDLDRQAAVRSGGDAVAEALGADSQVVTMRQVMLPCAMAGAASVVAAAAPAVKVPAFLKKSRLFISQFLPRTHFCVRIDIALRPLNMQHQNLSSRA
jgi:hypothetical protein